MSDETTFVPTPVATLVDLVRHNAQQRSRHSARYDYDGSVRAAWFLAVSSGMKFRPDEFQQYADKESPGYHSHDPFFGLCMEGIYKAAVRIGNITAARAVEEYLGRPRFTFSGETLFVGYQFAEWESEQHVTITSFRHTEKDGWYAVACSYAETHDRGVCPACGGYVDEEHRGTKAYKSKPIRQFKITPAALKALDAERDAFIRAWRGVAELTVTRNDVEGWKANEDGMQCGVGGLSWLTAEKLDIWFTEKKALTEPELVQAARNDDAYDDWEVRSVRTLFRAHHSVEDLPDNAQSTRTYEQVIAKLGEKAKVDWISASPAVRAICETIRDRVAPKTQIVWGKPKAKGDKG